MCIINDKAIAKTTPIFSPAIFLVALTIITLATLIAPNAINAGANTRANTRANANTAATANANISQDDCIKFESPLSGTTLAEPSCTISLNVTCPNLSRVDLRIYYMPDEGTMPVIGNLVSITRPPYAVFWNTAELPNQLFGGITIVADAVAVNGAQNTAQQNGIFLTHNPVEREDVPMPYALNAAAEHETLAAHARTFALGDPQKTASGTVAWNETGLLVSVDVQDPRFYTSRPGIDMRSMGLEVLIDQERGRLPHPTEGTMRIFVPLVGIPRSITYTPIIRDGLFHLDSSSQSVDFPHAVSPREFDGYRMQVTIPRQAFGRAIPDTIALNLALRMFDEDGFLQSVPLYGKNELEMFSPFVWHDFYKLPKPFIMNAGVRWTLFPLLGFVTTLLLYIGYVKLRGSEMLTTFERTEEEKAAFERISIIIAKEITKPGLTIDDISAKCGIPPQSINALIKRCTGYTFITYVQFCRTEVAKERLVSSKTSEKTIADLCGFSSAIEMENCFLKFCKTTPYRYRQRSEG